MILQCGWTERISSLLQRSVRKYLVLTRIHLYTFSSDDVYDFSTADGCVPVKTIVYVEILHSHANVLLLHLAGRTTEFRFSTYEEAQCWFRSILDSRRKYFLTVGASLTTLAGLAASNTPVIIPEVSPDTAESWQPPDSGSITGLGIRSMVQAAVGSSVKGGVQGIGQMVAALGNMISGPTDPQDLLDSILTERQVSAIYK